MAACRWVCSALAAVALSSSATTWAIDVAREEISAAAEKGVAAGRFGPELVEPELSATRKPPAEEAPRGPSERVTDGLSASFPQPLLNAEELGAAATRRQTFDRTGGIGDRLVRPEAEAWNPEAIRRFGSLDSIVAVGDDERFFCTGILIDRDVVLTAKHCGEVTRVARGPDATRPLQECGVERLEEHPDAAVDLALLFLDKPLAVAKLHRVRGIADVHAPQGMVLLAGFGSNRPDGRSGYGILRLGRVPSDGWGCDRARASRFGCVPGRNLVLLGANGRDTCDGDSGGPVFERWGNDWRLIGITSRPLASSPTRCGAGGVYERVDASRDWIDDVLGKREVRWEGR